MQAINIITENPDFYELHKYALADDDWESLEVFCEILEVSTLIAFN